MGSQEHGFWQVNARLVLNYRENSEILRQLLAVCQWQSMVTKDTTPLINLNEVLPPTFYFLFNIAPFGQSHPLKSPEKQARSLRLQTKTRSLFSVGDSGTMSRVNEWVGCRDGTNLVG